jgi:mono/diheme cytochrome c family protein
MQIIAAGALLLAAAQAPADTVLAPYESAARAADPAFAGFSLQRGEQLFRAKSSAGVAASCTSCHTADARQAGQHEKTGKVIEPLAPVANAKRFTDPAKVEKWFKRNCREVYARECTALEKGDFVSYMRSVR